MQFKKVENIDDLQGRATLYTFNIIQFTDFSGATLIIFFVKIYACIYS